MSKDKQPGHMVRVLINTDVNIDVEPERSNGRLMTVLREIWNTSAAKKMEIK